MPSRSRKAARAAARTSRAALALLLWGLLALLAPRAALSARWVEVRVVRDDARVELEPEGRGRAVVEHRLVFLVSGGPLTSLTLRGVDPDADPVPDAQLLPRDRADAGSSEGALPVTVRRVEVSPAPGEGGERRVDLELLLDGGAGVRRGAWVLVARYRTDLVASGALTGEGSLRELRWRGPSWDDGLDTTRATIVVPSAPTPPSVVEPGEDEAAPVFLSTLSRVRERDELEIVKPYAPRGEAVVWAARIDARAVGLATAPPAVHAPSASPPAREDPLRRALGAVGIDRAAPSPQTLAWVGAALVALAWALLVAGKARQARRTHAAREARARPLLPVPLVLRAPLSGALVVVGVWLQLHRPTPTLGALVLVAAALVAAHRAPTFRVRPRPPGRWLSVTPGEAFGRVEDRPSAWLDASTRAGLATFLVLLVAVGATAAALAHHGMADRAILVAVDAAVLTPIFFTGRVADLPPDLAVAPASFLRDVALRLPRLLGATSVRAVPRIRLSHGGADPDDLRLALVPGRPLSGLRSVVVGLSFGLGTFGWVGLPEILVRVVVGSPADLALAPVARRARAMQGARDDERVLAFVPRLPTAGITATLAAAVVARLVAPADAPERAADPPPAKRAA